VRLLLGSAIDNKETLHRRSLLKIAPPTREALRNLLPRERLNSTSYPSFLEAQTGGAAGKFSYKSATYIAVFHKH